MRNVLIAAIALVLGVLLGGVGPRTRIRTLEDQVEELQARDCRRGAMGTELATMLAAPRVAAAPADDPVPDGDTDGAPAEDGVRFRIGAEGDAPPAESMAAMREALELRRTQARAALIEDAEPDEAQLAEIDEHVATMNDELHDLAEDLVAEMRENGEPSRRDAMQFAADALDILIRAEDGIATSLDAEQRDAVDEQALDPFSYVDPALFDLLAELDRGAGAE